MSVWSALISAGSGLIDTIGSAIQGNKNRKNQDYLQHDAQEFTREEREAMQDYQTNERLASQGYNTREREAVQDWELEMWNKNNAYNSPAEQLARLRAAGVNPNTAVGMLNSSASVALNGSPQSISPQSAASGESGTGSTPVPAPNLLSGISEGLNHIFANELLEKQAGTEREKAALTSADREKVIAETAKTSEEKRQLEALWPLVEGRSELELKQIGAAINLASQQFETEKQRTLNEQQTERNLAAQEDETLSRAQLNRATKSLQESAADLNDANAELTEAKTDEQILKNVCESVKADLARSGILVDTNTIGAAIATGGAVLNKLINKGIIKRGRNIMYKTNKLTMFTTPLAARR